MEQLSQWDIEYIKCDDVVSYIFKYPYENNPFFFRALSQISIYDRERLINRLGNCCKGLSIHDITPALIRYAIEFNKCNNQKQYEEYFIKHNGEKGNPFVIEAKKEIEVRNNIVPLRLRLTVLFMGIALSLLFVWLAFLGNGTTSSIVGLLCSICILAAFALFIAALVFLFSPSSFIGNKN